MAQGSPTDLAFCDDISDAEECDDGGDHGNERFSSDEDSDGGLSSSSEADDSEGDDPECGERQADKHLLASQPSLAEGANASLKEANTEAIDATRADVAGIGHSGSLPLQVDGASIDHSGSPTCEPGDDGKCSILTPGIPPERRADQDEVALAVMGSVTDRLAGDQLDQSSEMLSETFRSSDVERKYGGVHVHGRGPANDSKTAPYERRQMLQSSCP
ncbi:hypothetical protein HPB52_024969 [Rhipicephalus sanguineus]|uniref:Uncharacterized protein n=1 Tax=Rhipicephalus sanguineus TaxID=34632 RepID=A0A9D4PA83_RHISA|nr:hypothetical protein HPB52_024969 [Rhipicephalus sanguineus]